MEKHTNIGVAKIGAAVLLAAVSAAPVHAATVTYYLNQSNENILPDGTNYLTVKIDDEGTPGDINFTVSTVPGAFSELPNFGIQSFGFNDPGNLLSASNISGPSGWGVSANTRQGGFGFFDWVVSDGGQNRQDPLQFSITGVTVDTIDSYFGPSSGTAGQGNAWFAAHVTDFGTSDTSITSAFFGGGDGPDFPPAAVPVPAAVWLFGSGLLGLVGVARRRSQA
jgi:hypothetical protein